MGKPTKTRWATGDPSYIIQPGAGKMDAGWVPGEKPPSQIMNWLFYETYFWETYFEDKTENIDRLMLRSAGNLSWNGSVLTFGSAIDIVFRVTTQSHINRIPAGTFTLNDGEVVVVKRNRGGNSPVALAQGSYPGLNNGEYDIVNDSSLIADDQENELILFRRNGSTLEIPALGVAYLTGSTFALGVYNSDTGGNVPIGGIIPFYDFNGALTKPTNFSFCDGSSVTVTGIGVQTLPDLSNRYLVGFGTEGGGDIDTAAWATSAVGNASHQVNLQHSHTVNSHTHDLANHTHTGGAHTHSVDIASFTSGAGSAHSHTIGSHTHTTPDHTHDGTGLYALCTLNDSSGSDSDGLFMQTMAVSSWNSNRGDDVGGSNAPGTSYENAVVVAGTTALDGAGTTGAGSGSTGNESSHTHSIDPPSTSSSSAGAVATGGPSTNTSGATAPGTDNQLSTTQSIQPRSIRVRFIMRTSL